MRSNGRAFKVALYDALAANDSAVEAMGNSEKASRAGDELKVIAAELVQCNI